MIQFLAIQSTYTHLQLATFQESTLIETREVDKFHATKKCIVALQELLSVSGLSFGQLSFIAANQGPGPFTTLRVAISLINGLSFATKIPLIGINGLEAFATEYENHHTQCTVILLNAFAHDIYYLIKEEANIRQGCMPIELLMQELSQKNSATSILFLGNGVDKYKADLFARFGNRAQFIESNPATVSIKQIGLLGLDYFKKDNPTSTQLQPLYIKAAF